MFNIHCAGTKELSFLPVGVSNRFPFKIDCLVAVFLSPVRAALSPIRTTLSPVLERLSPILGTLSPVRTLPVSFSLSNTA